MQQTLKERFNNLGDVTRMVNLTKGETVFVEFMGDKFAITDQMVTSTNLSLDDSVSYLEKLLKQLEMSS